MADPTPCVVTPEAVRMFLIDRRPEDNSLLDAQEFAPEQVAFALQMCVDKYNAMPPFLGNGWTIVTFPHRYVGVIGTAAILLRMMALNLTRNKLDYQTREGTAVQDKARAAEYLALAKDLSAEFDTLAKQAKVAQNLSEGYGSLGSQYAWWQY